MGLGAWGVCVCRSQPCACVRVQISLPLSLSLSLPLSLRVQISLELKYPEHPEWPLQLSRLYALLKDTGIAHKFALVAEDSGQARQHLEAQRQHGVRISLLQLHRDIDAPRGADGVPHFNRRRAAPIARMQHAHVALASAHAHGGDCPLHLHRRTLASAALVHRRTCTAARPRRRARSSAAGAYPSSFSSPA